MYKIEKNHLLYYYEADMLSSVLDMRAVKYVYRGEKYAESLSGWGHYIHINEGLKLWFKNSQERDIVFTSILNVMEL